MDDDDDIGLCYDFRRHVTLVEQMIFYLFQNSYQNVVFAKKIKKKKDGTKVIVFIIINLIIVIKV